MENDFKNLSVINQIKPRLMTQIGYTSAQKTFSTFRLGLD